MIYVRIELWPRGHEAKRELLHEIEIHNDGTGDNQVAHYGVAISRFGGFIMNGQQRSGTVRNFHRCRGVLALLGHALSDALSRPPPVPSSQRRPVHGWPTDEGE